MPGKLSDEEIDEIWEAYQELGSMTAVAEKLDHSKATIQKYVSERKEQEQAQADETNGHADDPQIDFSQLGMNEGEAQTGVDLATLQPGEFVEWYFNDDLDEIDVEGIGLFARKCNSKDAVPTGKKMADLLDRMPSKVANDLQIDWIADDYWTRAAQYVSAKEGTQPEQVKRHASENNLAWVKVSTSQARTRGMAEQGGVQGAGSVPQPTEGHQANGVGQPPAGHRQQGERVGAVPQQGGGGGEQAQLMQQMLEEMRRERKQIMELMGSQQQPQTTQQDSGFADQINEIVEAQQALEAMQGNDDELEQVVNAFQQELQQIQHQIQNGQGQGAAPDDPIAAAMTNLTQRQDVDPQVIGEIATNVSSQNDPEVRKKEIDREIEQMKMQNRQETVETLIDGLGEAVQNMSGIAELAQSINGQEPQPEPEPQPQPEREPVEQPSQDDFSIDGVVEEADTETDSAAADGGSAEPDDSAEEAQEVDDDNE